jgi:hypothetical protein
LVGFWEYDFYIGIAGLLMIVVGVAAGARRTWIWLAPACLFLAIGLDLRPLHLDVWSSIERLPVWRTQRVPSRFLMPALTALIMVAAIGWQSLLARLLSSAPRARALRAIGVALAGWMALDLFAQSRPWYSYAVSDNSIAPHDHSFGKTSSPLCRLDAATPNRLVYAVNPPVAGTYLLPVIEAQGRMDWRARTVPGAVVMGRLAVVLEARPQRLEVFYTPPRFYLGIALTMATMILGAALEVCRRRSLVPDSFIRSIRY